MSQMKDIVHENLNVFVGACVDPPNLCLLWHYCSKGSLNVSRYYHAVITVIISNIQRVTLTRYWDFVGKIWKASA